MLKSVGHKKLQVKKYCLPVMATTFPSNRFRQSDPKLGPLNHIRKKCAKNIIMTTPAITEPTVMPIMAAVPNPWTILFGYF